MKRRMLSVLFALCMLLCLLPSAAFAEEMPICPNCGSSEYVTKVPGFGYPFFSDPDVGHYQHYRCDNVSKHNTWGAKGFDGPLLPHRFVNGVCKDCEYKCRHNNTSTIGDGVYWLTCSKCNFVEEKSFPVFDLNAPDKVCRTQDCEITFTVPEGSTQPGYNWDFSLKGDGAELTPVDGVCTATIKAEWYVDGENSFKVQAGAYVDGIYFYQTKYITIVDEHTGGTATCADKAVCEICRQPYGALDRANHVGGTEVRGAEAATCTEPGYTGDTHCLGCNALLRTGEVIPAEGHQGGAATCADKAVCEICRQPYGELDKTNHVGGTEVRGAEAATCTEPGYTGDTHCLGCDALLKTGEVIPAQGHQGGTATCADKAVCEICRQPYGELDKTNHVGGTEVRDAKAATCTEPGYTGDTYCLGCDALLKTGEVIPAEGHQGGTATTTEKAVFEKCGRSYGELLPAGEPDAPAQDPAADETDSPATGDSGVLLLAGGLLLSMAAMAAAVLGKKRFFRSGK